LDNKACQQLLR